MLGGDGRHRQQRGGRRRVDGQWPVCLPHRSDGTIAANCQVLSFGVNDDPSWENQMAEDYGCEVFAHDPTIAVGTQQQNGLLFAKRVHFIPLGLEGLNYEPGKYGRWPMRTLSSLMEQHNVTHIHVLKADIEYSEWAFLQESYASGTLQHVDQIMLEIHFWPDQGRSLDPQLLVRQYYRALKDLENWGFKIYDYHENPLSDLKQFGTKNFACCHEVAWIRPSALEGAVSEA
jgi:hypothetical protein